MNISVDTSVLVAASPVGHVHHARAAWWFDNRERMVIAASWHAMADTWATLSRIPVVPPVSPSAVRQIVVRWERQVQLVPPSPTIYREAMRRCSERGLRSGVVHDALHLVTARNSASEAILTYDESDFLRIREDGDPRIVVPPDPPGFPPELRDLPKQ